MGLLGSFFENWTSVSHHGEMSQVKHVIEPDYMAEVTCAEAIAWAAAFALPDVRACASA